MKRLSVQYVGTVQHRNTILVPYSFRIELLPDLIAKNIRWIMVYVRDFHAR